MLPGCCAGSSVEAAAAEAELLFIEAEVGQLP
eukprot:CAMPEP_0115729500 /NCGR_PEP_ID=MMETSP0272-20121206/83539_1 /TAXON_ID=71861 /ORGANISM="Scrippsiella trochoidea, Strain CCMP3099" /LENGTH=31 /DNA_ID= /DNA_START= /DNA_END= /DNA_ORIENTATION=